ncbi:MAG: tetratricopeptide repeat protein [Algibacter sp.]
MKTSLKVILVLVGFSVVVTSCSRKKDKFINRNFHAVTTEFNTLYNGYIALDRGRQSLNDNYFDNYWEVLPIERMQIMEEVVLPGQSKNEDFTRAEEKAVKAIQKHSMNIDGKERNPQIDEAYLLLGKSRYFDQRFVPALEAFNYILYKYPSSDKINQAKVWREKTNIRLDNDELAIKNLKRLLIQEELDDQDLADATSILAQAYLNTKSIDSAITQLEIASNHTKSNDERGRYRFIQGQLYNELGKKDSANYAFDRVIELNRKTPRIYMISAYVEKIKNFDYENGNKFELLEHLTELEEDRENRPFLDKIYHQIGEYYLTNSSDSSAVTYYNKSLRTNSKDNVLMARNYEILGDMDFDASIYREAGAYYDSTMGKLKLNSKPYRVIKRKRDNLEDVIYYEDIAKVNDSILHLVNLPEAERLTYFEGFVETLKEEAEEEAKRLKVAERNKGLATVNNNIGGQQNVSRSGSPTQAAAFYFYNPTTVAYGKNEFIKIWGDRTLEDDWRWSVKKASIGGSNSSLNNAITANASNEELFDPQFYISKIPSTEKEIDSLSKDRNYAYYQLGLIYKEKFKEYELAKDKFQNLLKSNPEERLILPSKYNLYKIYELLGENDEASIAKEDIIKGYPESRYATILTNPELANLKDENSPTSLYEITYALHEAQKYAQVIAKCDDYINTFDGEPIVPKFELLKATALGRLKGFEAYKKGINHLAVTYANTAEGKQAQHIEKNVLPKVASKAFVNDSIVNNFKVVYQFKNSEAESMLAFNDELDSVLTHIKYYKLDTSVDVYNEEETFVLVHGLKNAAVARTFDQLFEKEDKGKIKEPYFVVSSANYQIIQIHKNLEDYLNKESN